MRFLNNKSLWIALMVFALPLLFAVDYGVKVFTSVYKKDLGNGVVIYADDYVKSGRWVFDCKYSRLVSREAVPAPLAELDASGEIAIGKVTHSSRRNAASAKEAVSAIIKRPEWYSGLQYVFTGVDESSNIWRHKFFVLADYSGVKWALEVDQILRPIGSTHFVVTGLPYYSDTYVDYDKAFAAAVKSCPAPQ